MPATSNMNAQVTASNRLMLTLNKGLTGAGPAADITQAARANDTHNQSSAIVIKDPIKIELPVFKPKNECNVIKIIQKEWEREVERLNQKKLGKRSMNSQEKSIVQSGHAEIETNKVLYIYGNSLEVL